MSLLRIQPGDRGEVLVSFRYDPEVIGLIKTLPVWGRRWNPETKEWTVRESFTSELIGLLEFAGHRVLVTGARAAPPPRLAPRGETWADALLDAVGPQRVEKVHRALVKVLHPDVGGDDELMAQLNRARDRRTVAR